MTLLTGFDNNLMASIKGSVGMASLAAPQVANSRALKSAQRIETAGWWGAAMGAVTSAIGAYYAADAQKYQLKSQASSLEFQQEISRRNASLAQQQAESIRASGQQEIGRYTAQVGQQQATERARVGARGIQGGVGSTAEVAATTDLIKQVDVLTMSSNTIRQASAARMQAQNYQAQATILGASAANARRSAASISTWSGPMSSLLGSAGGLGIEWARTQYAKRSIR
jgi:hypothetical protein